MRAAIYARFSTDMQRDESIEDQIRVCRQFADREGWEIVEVFSDKGFSGGKVDRPGYQALLTAARSSTFNIMICEDVSRLWRDEAEQSRCVKELQYLDKEIIGINDGVDTRREGFEYLLAIHGVMNAGYRREIGKRTHRGMTGIVLNGRCAGGKAYGYQSIYENVTDSLGRTQSKPIGRKIVADEEKWVKCIFEWYTEGYSPRWIASALNEKGIPSPGSRWERKQRRRNKWVSSAIYGDITKGTGILNNELYIGRLIWNRSKWVEKPDGKKERRERPKSEWVIMEHPELRIIPQRLWKQVKARQQETREKSASIREALHKNARTGAGPKYLFSGLLKCSECGSSFVMVSKYQYGCASHTNGGKHACSNKIKVSRNIVEDRLLTGIKKDLFSDEAFSLFRKETSRLLRAAKKKEKPEKIRLSQELAKVEGKIDNLIAAIEQGIITETTKGRLQAVEAEKKRLTKALSVDTSNLDALPDMLPQALERYRVIVNDLETTTQRQVSKARAQIKKILGEIKIVPSKSGDYLEAELNGNFAGLMSLSSLSNYQDQINLVAGAGFEPTTFGL